MLSAGEYAMHDLPAPETDWTEERVLSLPPGEHDYFDRKSGKLLESSDSRNSLAKAISAFANSGGGNLVLGLTDEGLVDGVEAIRKSSRTTTRDWLEQVIPSLVDYPLSHFRVHEILPTGVEGSKIPKDMVLIVIEIFDSPLAPHQSRSDCKYYHRRGGRSEPAGHFYLELLRNRLVAPRLEVRPIGLRVRRVYVVDDHCFVQAYMMFRIENVGRVAAYKWGLAWQFTTSDELQRRYVSALAEMPPGADRASAVRIDDTILPGFGVDESRHFGLHLRAGISTVEELKDDVLRLLPEALDLQVRVATEVSPGNWTTQPFWAGDSLRQVLGDIAAGMRL